MKKLSLALLMLVLMQNTATAQSCLPEGLFYIRQAQVDSFPINYPGCTSVEGDVFIGEYGNDISNLNGFSALTSIGGSLYISQIPATNLAGFDALTSIGGNLDFYGCYNLESLAALDGLTSIGGDLSLSYNSLTSLSGLESITYIGGSIGIWYNDYLQNLMGLPVLTSISGNLSIGNNANMNSLTGLNALTSIWGNFELRWNKALPDLSGLEALSSIGGNMSIWGNTIQSDFTGLDALASIAGDFIVVSDSSLSNFSGLISLTSIGGEFYLEFNTSLINFTGLESLNSIWKRIFLSNNNALVNLSGLNNTAIGGYLDRGSIYIMDNDALTSLGGLESSNDTHTLTSLDIFANNSLSDCAVWPICDLLFINHNDINFYNNAVGCNNPDEVEVACNILYSVEELKGENEFSLYPNPASQSIIISSKHGVPIEKVTIYNQLGQKVIQEMPLHYTIDVSKLQKGMYFVEVLTRQYQSKQKLIIN